MDKVSKDIQMWVVLSSYRVSGLMCSFNGYCKMMLFGIMQVKKNYEFCFFSLRKTANDTACEFLDPTKLNNITHSSFQPRLTYIIVHGFLGWGNEEWILQLKNSKWYPISFSVLRIVGFTAVCL